MTEIQKAVNLLRAGELVAFPTETVYGLGADACNEKAIQKIFTVKERPSNHPLIVHIANSSQLADWVTEIPPAALKLTKVFWPGPLTIIFKKKSHVLDVITGGQDTIGIRIPSHPIAKALLEAFGGGVVAPSANKFTHISPTTAQAVQEELGEHLKLILDGGACLVGLESTILDMSGAHPKILRPGMVSVQSITEVLGMPVSSHNKNTVIRVPGMHHLHYAPLTPTVLIPSNQLADFLGKVSADDLPMAVIAYSKLKLPKADEQIQLNFMPTDAITYAHELYHTLRTLDNQYFKKIIIEEVPRDAAWDAIRDRLSKAAAERKTER